MAEEIKISVDENNPKLTEVVEKEAEAISDIENSYNNAIDSVEGFVNTQTEAIKNNAQTQIENQNAATDLAIEKINQEKNEAAKSYQREQSGAYVDWQKQSNEYGVSAEQMAATGMTRTGYSESSKVAMYNQYQNRVATAREVYNKAVLSYDYAIKEAKLQNSSALAEIAATAFEQQITIALQGLQYKNALLSERISNTMQAKQLYGNLYQNVYDRLLDIEKNNASMKFTASENEKNRQHEIKKTEIMYPELNVSSGGNSSVSYDKDEVTTVDFDFVYENVAAEMPPAQAFCLYEAGLLDEVNNEGTLSFDIPKKYKTKRPQWKVDVIKALIDNGYELNIDAFIESDFGRALIENGCNFTEEQKEALIKKGQESFLREKGYID